VNYQHIKYVLFDGTYFHKDGCLIVLINNETGKPFYYDYVKKENYDNVYPMTCHLKALGLSPKAFTLDGHPGVIKALLNTWSNLIIQRCLFHIQNQGLMWIRKPPKTKAGYYLRAILKTCGSMKTETDMTYFLDSYVQWRNDYQEEISLLNKTDIAYTDLRRTMSLIDNALKDMFHFVKDRNIVPTTNYIESFFKQLKYKYRGHQGLSLKHKIAYLKWYCFYKN
jgi:transposase-like protein